MATISHQNADIFSVRPPPGARQGDVIDVIDSNKVARRMKLGIPMGDEFTFEWVEIDAEARPVKQGDEWLIQVEGHHKPGDVVSVTTSKGVYEQELGEPAGDGLFHQVKRNRFKLNPVGDNPKWCVSTCGPQRSGDIITVTKADNTTQRHQLITEVQPNVWTSKKV